MSIYTNSKIVRLISITLTLLIGTGFAYLLFTDSEIRVPPDWPPGIRRYSNSISGYIRVVDESSGTTLFSYYNDGAMFPSKFIKNSTTGEWTVTFSSREKVM